MVPDEGDVGPPGGEGMPVAPLPVTGAGGLADGGGGAAPPVWVVDPCGRPVLLPLAGGAGEGAAPDAEPDPPESDGPL